MIGNPDYNADAYDIACRVPGCPFMEENVSPAIVALLLHEHIRGPCTLRTEPAFTMRIVAGFEGTDRENPVRTSAYGWFRPLVPWDHVEETPDEWHARKQAQDNAARGSA